MKVENDKKTNLLDTLTKPNQLKLLKEKGSKGIDEKVDGNLTDTVELTSRKAEIERIKERVKAAPVIQQDKVDQIRESIKANTYNIKGEMVARSILKSHFLDQLL
ncbi:MAG: flagellar biosynthesis anti-sigma factor FlgM [Syntrophus sp. (in: bacteria)]|nr:flagellar biosynthesis anti-sigma factor FlgM [Syntrophus sp. (in: bacteria)]